MAAPGLETADAEFLTDIKRMSWTILAASSLSSSARLLEPPLWVFNPPGVEPFDAAWNNFRLVTSLSGVLLIVFLLVGGLLGDLYGRRRIWMIGLVGFIVCNLLIMAFPGLAWRIVLQFCALAFGSLFAPLILATLNLTFPDRSRTLAFAIFVSVNAIALQLAWLQGQFLSARFGWRAAYVLPILAAIASAVWVYRVVPETRSGGQRRFETYVYSGWTLVVLATVFGLTVVPVASDLWRIVLGAAVLAGVVGIVMVMWWDIRAPGDLLLHRTVRTRDLTVLVITGAILQFLLIGFSQRTLSMFQVVREMPAIVAAIALAPMLFGLSAATFVFLKSMDNLMARAVIAGGLGLMAAALAGAALIPYTAGYLLFSLPLAVFGAGFLIANVIWTSAFLRTAVARHHGVNAGISSATGAIGGAIGSVVTGNLLAMLGLEIYGRQLTQAGVNVVEAIEALRGFQALATLDPVDIAVSTEFLHFDLVASYRTAFAAAYAQVLWVMVAFALASATVIGLGLRRSLLAREPSRRARRNEDDPNLA